MLASGRPRWVLAALLTVVAVAVVPSAASAATRYASATGGGVGCTSDNPCELESAMKVAQTGDEVVLSPGDYPLTKTIDDPAEITIRGVAGQPRPRLLFSGPSQAGLRLMHGSLLRDVEIEQAAPVGALDTSGARLDRVVVRGAPATSCAISALNVLMRDTIVVAEMNPICSFAYGVTNASSFRNVTAIATQQNMPAINTYSSGPSGKIEIELRNVIAQGGPGGCSFSIVTDGLGGQATFTATHTNYTDWSGMGDKILFVDGAGNQHEAPTFVNAAGGDYRQAAGSVTINGGLDEPLNGSFDVEGDPRRIGPTDIGADEFVPAPTVATGPATAISAQSATLIGSVTANAVPTSYHFEYGLTTDYGSATPATDPGAGLGALPVAATLDALSPGTTYHFRLVAANKTGVARGYDQSFTTPPAAPIPSTPSSTEGFAGVRLVSTRLTLSGKLITVQLSCPAATVGGCSGRTSLSVRGRRSSARRVTLGRARFSIAAGDQAQVRVRVSRAGQRRLKGVRRLRGRGTNTAHDGAGVSKTTVVAVTVRRRPGGRVSS
jgi:hypothetical protein